MLRVKRLLYTTLSCCLLLGCNAKTDTGVNEKVDSRVIESLLLDAQQALTSKQTGRVFELTSEILLQDPTQPDALYLLGQSYALEKKFPDAVDTVSLIPVEHPKLGLSSILLAAEWSLAAEDVLTAEQKYTEVIARQPSNIGARRRLAQILNDQGRRYEASNHLGVALESGNISVRELLSLVRVSDPFHDSEDRYVHQRRGSEVVLSDLAEARSLYAQHKPSETRDMLRKLRTSFPQSEAVAAFALKFHAEMLDSRAVADICLSSPEAIAEEPEYWSGLGTWLLSQDRTKLAVRAFCEAVQRDPSDGKAYLKLSQALQALGQTDAATSAVDRYDAIRALAHTAHLINFENGGEKEFLLIAQQLEDLNRPWEALGWRINLARLNGTLRQKMPYFAQQASAFRLKPNDQRWVVCGVSVKDWPLPTLESLSDQKRSRSIATQSRYSLRFEEIAKSKGLDFQYRPHGRDDPLELMLHQTPGGGIAVCDYDNDGWPDVYFSQANGELGGYSNTEPNQLFRNRLGKYFELVPNGAGIQDAGYGAGVCAADLNQDGFIDLVVSNIGRNICLISNGDGTFRSQAYGDSENWTSSIAVADISGDHLPDIIDVNYIDDPAGLETPCWANADLCAPHRFDVGNAEAFINDGRGKFERWGRISNR